MLTAHRSFSQFCHVLHRLLVPRHPPNALTSLTTGNFVRSVHRFAAAAASAPLSWRTGIWPSRSVVYVFFAVLWLERLSIACPAMQNRAMLDPRRLDITRRYRTSVGRARCLVMSKTRAFHIVSLRCAQRIASTACSCFVQLFNFQRRCDSGPRGGPGKI